MSGNGTVEPAEIVPPSERVAALPPMPDRWARVYATHTANPSWSNAATANEPQQGKHIGIVRYVAVCWRRYRERTTAA